MAQTESLLPSEAPQSGLHRPLFSQYFYLTSFHEEPIGLCTLSDFSSAKFQLLAQFPTRQHSKSVTAIAYFLVQGSALVMRKEV